MARFDAMGVERAQVTLHVGAGTFLPVKAEDTSAHVMHSEWREIAANTAAAINRAKAEGQRVIAVGTTAREYLLVFVLGIGGSIFGARLWARTEGGKSRLDSWKLNTPVLGSIWMKYQVAQLGRVLSTLLLGGIPLMQALETAFTSLESRLLRKALENARQLVKEGQPLSRSLESSKIFPPLSIDMIEVGESTGALPALLNSVAEFYEEDVTTQMTATFNLIEPAIMIFMGTFVAFVLVALYLPIFSLSDTLGGGG